MERLIEFEIVKLAVHREPENKHQQHASREDGAANAPSDKHVSQAGDQQAAGTNGERRRQVHRLRLDQGGL